MVFLRENVSLEECRDSGLALVLISLILALTVSPRYFLPIATGVLVVTMSAPKLFKPFAKFWFGFSHALGSIVSKLLLTFLFYVLVTPVGLVRRVLGKDAMQLKGWKKSSTSVFQNRDHLYKRQDLDHPY